MYVIEETPKIFDLMKNILRINKREKNIFLYGNADFSGDIKKYISENNIITFRYINPVYLTLNLQSDPKPVIDLAVLGNCGNFTSNLDITRLGDIKSVLLNIENSQGLNYSHENIQVITCGLKEKDTVIFSSINLDEGNVILDLQRNIKNINGETLEAFECQVDIPEFAQNAKTEDLLPALSALAFCGLM